MRPDTSITADRNARVIHAFRLTGYAMTDTHGVRLGSIGRVWVDRTTGALTALGLTTGMFPRQTRVVPVDGLRIDEARRSVQVGFAGDVIRHAPRHNTDVPLSVEQARKVAQYYDNA